MTQKNHTDDHARAEQGVSDNKPATPSVVESPVREVPDSGCKNDAAAEMIQSAPEKSRSKRIIPSKVFEGSALPGNIFGEESLTAFIKYIQSLEWGPGNRDESGYWSFLRGGKLGINPDTALEMVSNSIKSTGGSVDSSKLKNQLRRAYAHVGEKGDTTTILPKLPKAEYSPDKLRSVASRVSGIDADWLRTHSPVSIAGISSGKFLEHLYEPGEKIVVFTDYHSQGQYLFEVGAVGNTLPTGGVDGVWFLVNPVDGKEYPNPRQKNKPSRRSEESVTSWRYLVLESDKAEEKDWLACLVQLPLKFAAIYTSGGRSIHALVRIDAESKAHLDEERNAIKPIVVSLGADPGALTAVRLSRLPGTVRGGKPQQLLYLNPNPDGSPIISRAVPKISTVQ